MSNQYQYVDYACEVCGNTPDDEGVIEHGRGCFVVSENGGGVTMPDVNWAEYCQAVKEIETLRGEVDELKAELALVNSERMNGLHKAQTFQETGE